MTEPTTIRVGLDASLAPWIEEAKYVLRTLLRIAGYARDFRIVAPAERPPDLDLYYGPRNDVPAAVSIRRSPIGFAVAATLEPTSLERCDGVPFLRFPELPPELARSPDGLRFGQDVVLVCWWLLRGAGEVRFRRDRWDNLHAESELVRSGALLSTPLVSIYGALLRDHFRERGATPLVPEWSEGGGAAFVFSHDVDYPQIIRSIETLRLLRSRGRRAFPSIAGVLRGTNHFWKFREWIELERRYHVRPAFYFMSRRGSLLRYALGTPDAFYDVGAPAFRELFRLLGDEGCEVGLHASFHAHRSEEMLRREKTALEGISNMVVGGVRHHYWHLDPERPEDTLAKHERVGLAYDSSLALELYPGFRRGICHPYRVFHPAERRELSLVELPPAWMDDHFDRRLAANGIGDPASFATGLLDTARSTGGAIVVDYHARGMNEDFYPRYGRWLADFVEAHAAGRARFRMPGALAASYVDYEAALERRSVDRSAAPQLLPALDAAAPDTRRVDLLSDGDSARWDAFVEAHPDRTVYHTTAWARVTHEGLGHRPFLLREVDDSGGIRGVLPLFLVRGALGRRLVSVPMRDRGGILALDGDSARRLLARAVELTRELGCKYLELRSLGGIDPTLAREHGLRSVHHWITTRIDLGPGPERLWKGLDKNFLRWAIRKGRRSGLRVETRDDAAGMDLFYDLFARTRCSMGIPPFPRAFFRSMGEHLVRRGRAVVFFLYRESTPVHALICLSSGDTLIAGYAAPQNEWRKEHPNEVLFWHSIEWACHEGYRVYDFGADSPRQTGLLWFKKKWGGVQHPVYYDYFLNGVDSPPVFDSSSPAVALLRTAWRRLPEPLARPLGAWVTRNLS